MDKYQVRACVDAGTGLVYTNTEGTPQGIFAINTTGANDGDVLTYFSASGTVGWTPGGGGGSFWSLTGNGGTDPVTNFLGTTDSNSLAIRTNNIERLTIDGTSGALNFNSDAGGGVTSTISSGGSGSSISNQFTGTQNGTFTIDNSYIALNYTDASSNNCFLVNTGIGIGIGTLSPANKLHVVGTVQIEDGTQAAGYVLTSDANGVASWQAAGGGGATWGSITGTLSDQTDLQTALDALVPYTGATNDVDLDTFSLNAKSLHVKGTGGAGHLGLKHQSADATANTNETAIFADVNGDIKYKNDSLYYTTLKTSLNTADRVYTFPNASGTLALTTDGLTVGTTTINSGTVGRVFFQGSGNVLQQNSNLNFDTTNGLIIGGATARGTRLTVVNSANTQATKIFVQRNAADSADYTTLRGDGSVDFANIGSTANVLVYANGSTLIQTYGSAGFRNSLFGLANATSITGGTVAYNTFVGAESTLSSSTGTTAYNTAVGFTTNITNANNCTIVGTFTRMNGATRAIVIGGRSTAGPVRDVTGTDVILFGYGTDANALNYTNSAVFYFNNANASTWFHSNGNLGLFGKKYQILNDSTGTAANRLNTYMDINATNTLTIHNGTAPAVNITDGVQVYGADVVAGNTALFVRTENGAILKLYQETTGVGSATRVGGGGTTLTDTDTFDGYTIAQVVKALRNQGILA